MTNKPDEALLRKLAQSLPPPPRTMGGDNFNLASRLSVMIRPAEARFAVNGRVPIRNSRKIDL